MLSQTQTRYSNLIKDYVIKREELKKLYDTLVVLHIEMDASSDKKNITDGGGLDEDTIHIIKITSETCNPCKTLNDTVWPTVEKNKNKNIEIHELVVQNRTYEDERKSIEDNYGELPLLTYYPSIYKCINKKCTTYAGNNDINEITSWMNSPELN
jgi:thiol-disulfide isomerase/thioredoxin